jgi:glyoxylase-like metal-dependent hydrolase (beta-lactamase superfamily II)
MSLEDEVSDVVGKALRGLEMSPTEVARAAGVGKDDLQRILDGGFDQALVRKIAPFLGLDADALAGLPSYLPNARSIKGVRRIILPFRRWTVNAWLLEISGKVLLFDTGWGGDDILSEIDPSAVDMVLITHGHPDHVGGIEALEKKGKRVISETEAQVVGEFEFGEISVRAVDLSGHCEPAVGYFIKGFQRQLLVAGDAIFAGSAGGCANRRKFHLALENLRAVLEIAEEECLILPGHGPMTSVAEEKTANPFLGY